MAEGLTKKQIKELRKLEKMQSRNLEEKNGTVKWIAITVISAIFLLLFVGIIVVAKNKNNPQTATGKAQFASNGHTRIMTKDGKDSTNSANQSQKMVTMVEYGDLQCPACKAYHPVVLQLLQAFPERLKLVFKNFPLTQVHPNAMAAAVAAEAAAKQGKFFEFVDNAYNKQEEWAGQVDPQAKFEEYVKSLGMNVEQFKKDQKDPSISKLISDQNTEGIQNGVTGTPSFFIDGKKIDNPANIEDFKKIISEELKKVVGEDVAPIEKVPSTSPTQAAPEKLPLVQ
jgi:protein-disulfide isomerase